MIQTHKGNGCTLPDSIGRDRALGYKRVNYALCERQTVNRGITRFAGYRIPLNRKVSANNSLLGEDNLNVIFTGNLNCKTATHRTVSVINSNCRSVNLERAYVMTRSRSRYNCVCICLHSQRTALLRGTVEIYCTRTADSEINRSRRRKLGISNGQRCRNCGCVCKAGSVANSITRRILNLEGVSVNLGNSNSNAFTADYSICVQSNTCTIGRASRYG